MKRLFAACLALALLAPATAMAKPTKTDKTNAAKECKAERGSTAATREAFRVRYGTNKNGKNAFGKCVSRRSKSEEAQRKAARSNAAKDCKTERGTTPESREAFRVKYGTNKNGNNAYGKCVSQKAKANKKKADAADAAKIKARKSAAKECATERGSTTESREAFRVKYGTNKNGRNAFGKCVSTKAKAKS